MNSSFSYLIPALLVASLIVGLLFRKKAQSSKSEKLPISVSAKSVTTLAPEPVHEGSAAQIQGTVDSDYVS
ncbi:MAG: hypothetical protein JZU67_01510, partial [Burkholderiaceae bacterium]|nr:hypothetical protein [Burkholderiaceae bacterium]